MGVFTMTDFNTHEIHTATKSEQRNLSLYLTAMGLDPEYKGFTYLKYILVNFDSYIVCKNGLSYISQETAKYFNINVNAMERCIRNLLNAAWNSENGEFLRALFSFVPEGYCPTYSEFISTMLIFRRMAMAFADIAVCSDFLDELYEKHPEAFMRQLTVETLDVYDAYGNMVLTEYENNR